VKNNHKKNLENLYWWMYL